MFIRKFTDSKSAFEHFSNYHERKGLIVLKGSARPFFFKKELKGYSLYLHSYNMKWIDVPPNGTLKGWRKAQNNDKKRRIFIWKSCETQIKELLNQKKEFLKNEEFSFTTEALIATDYNGTFKEGMFLLFDFKTKETVAVFFSE